jgi:hypothetical protein
MTTNPVAEQNVRERSAILMMTQASQAIDGHLRAMDQTLNTPPLFVTNEELLPLIHSNLVQPIDEAFNPNSPHVSYRLVHQPANFRIFAHPQQLQQVPVPAMQVQSRGLLAAWNVDIAVFFTGVLVLAHFQ